MAPDEEPGPGLPAEQTTKETAVANAPMKTPGGVEIEDLVVGTGTQCKPHQTVKVFYTGTLKSNGKKFDSNVGGAPIEFPLDNLIAGWQEGIPGMKVGGKRKLTIPYKLGYGERGAGADIPPRADLIFEIELLGVK